MNLPAPDCGGYVPKSLRDPVPGAPLPAKGGLTVGTLASHDDAQTGQLERSNSTKQAALEIIDTCEARYAALVKSLTTKPWWRF